MMFHLLVGISANGYPFSDIPTVNDTWAHRCTLQYCKVQRCAHVSFISI